MIDRMNRRLFARFAAAAPFVAMALTHTGARTARAAHRCDLPERFCSRALGCHDPYCQKACDYADNQACEVCGFCFTPPE